MTHRWPGLARQTLLSMFAYVSRGSGFSRDARFTFRALSTSFALGND